MYPHWGFWNKIYCIDIKSTGHLFSKFFNLHISLALRPVGQVTCFEKTVSFESWFFPLEHVLESSLFVCMLCLFMIVCFCLFFTAHSLCLCLNSPRTAHNHWSCGCCDDIFYKRTASNTCLRCHRKPKTHVGWLIDWLIDCFNPFTTTVASWHHSL